MESLAPSCTPTVRCCLAAKAAIRPGHRRRALFRAFTMPERNGQDYCTFNGLMVSARVAGGRLVVACRHPRRRHAPRRRHGGDHRRAGRNPSRALQRRRHFTTLLREAVHRRTGLIAPAFSDCDCCSTVAGADPHVDDPLGGWLHHRKELFKRDYIVSIAAGDRFAGV